MPISGYYKGSGSKVMKKMKKEYGEKKGKEVFYATAQKRGMKGSGTFSQAEMKQGYKTLCSASDLMEMNVDRVEHAGPLMAHRRNPRTAIRSESTKGSY